MDPDACLRDLLAAAENLEKMYAALALLGEPLPEEVGTLAFGITALHDWITKGGCLPKEWSRHAR